MNTQFNFADYQSQTALTAIYPGRGTTVGILYCALKLAGESGEVAENVGKAVRDDGALLLDLGTATFDPQELTTERKAKLVKELGDVMWYVSQLCTELGVQMSDVAEANIAKLQSRKERGTLQGSGDDR